MKMRTAEVGNAGFCSKCEQWNPDGPDVCLGRLRGVTAACCGHGIRMPYVAFGAAAFDYDPAGFTTVALYDEQAEAYFAHVKEHPDEPFSIGFDMDTWTAKYGPTA
jgi:hypothetical protein